MSELLGHRADGTRNDQGEAEEENLEGSKHGCSYSGGGARRLMRIV